MGGAGFELATYAGDVHAQVVPRVYWGPQTSVRSCFWVTSLSGLRTEAFDEVPFGWGQTDLVAVHDDTLGRQVDGEIGGFDERLFLGGDGPAHVGSKAGEDFVHFERVARSAMAGTAALGSAPDHGKTQRHGACEAGGGYLLADPSSRHTGRTLRLSLPRGQSPLTPGARRGAGVRDWRPGRFKGSSFDDCCNVGAGVPGSLVGVD